MWGGGGEEGGGDKEEKKGKLYDFSDNPNYYIPRHHRRARLDLKFRFGIKIGPNGYVHVAGTRAQKEGNRGDKGGVGHQPQQASRKFDCIWPVSMGACRWGTRAGKEGDEWRQGASTSDRRKTTGEQQKKWHQFDAWYT